MHEWEKDWEFPHIESNGHLIRCNVCNKKEYLGYWKKILDEHENCKKEKEEENKNEYNHY